jgi:hypothetical protein
MDEARQNIILEKVIFYMRKGKMLNCVYRKNPGHTKLFFIYKNVLLGYICHTGSIHSGNSD